ncbi:PREDICTED: uncharacterized protein LOC107353659 [Acropora digitifera]|uniref:uncharacterized protein LOC107353659 n=1 Tax=Acropora digitifera TaxID=70779 RepID=UPI00077B0485|nr:PREDICTED: uncharacterized protein LOC107353659 [Acropora digitifera]
MKALFEGYAKNGNTEKFYGAYYAQVPLKSTTFFPGLSHNAATLLATKLADGMLSYCNDLKSVTNKSQSSKTALSEKENAGLQYVGGYVLHKLYKKFARKSLPENQQAMAILKAGKLEQDTETQKLVSILNRGETSTVQHQAVAANYVGSQGPSAIPETKQQHSLDAVVASCSGNVAGGEKKEGCQPSTEDKKPPQLSFKLKKRGDVPKSTEKWSDDHLPIDILLLTSVESCDFLSCFSFLDQPFKCYKREIGYVYFGRMGDVSDQEKLKVALINCSKGAAARGGSLTVVLNAVKVLQPKAVFSVGTCITLGLETARIGDVVISSKLPTAEGFITPGSPLLGSLVRDAPYGWDAPLKNPEEWEVKVHCSGDILSQSLTEKLQNVNVCEQYPKAVAIETEGEGVYAAAYDANIEWKIMKKGPFIPWEPELQKDSDRMQPSLKKVVEAYVRLFHFVLK